MKNILLIAILGIVLTGCATKGNITTQPHDFIEIHGKMYKLMSVVPCTGCASIWIMYPKDSTDKMPEVLNFQSGKTHETVIKIQ